MSYSIYDGSIVLAQDALSALSSIITKAEAHASAADLPAARLYEDMLPLSFQVYMVTDAAQKLAARGTDVAPLDLGRELNDFAAMKDRIAQVQDILAKVDRAAFEARAEAEVTIGLGVNKEAKMQLKQYVHGYVVPNIFFHTTTAYGILRKEGVPLGKMDYLSAFIGKFLPQ
ncbi:hypothetical protein B0T10DRAFT_474941 [Thelonectria olida]|uniref:DUF1993 domain-containing protein n=1 Tax=Thelonectria olida TaxID=1576542 RepID=A0A9P9ATW0_9HYPO|nr:hypothetical protein B0T10DRAFT_474941 [Thelonectria olida]